MKTINLTNAVSIVSSTMNKALGLIPTGNGLRTRPSAQLMEDIGNPENVEVLMVEGNVVIMPAREGTKALKVNKGRYLYDTELAKTIANLAGVDFEAREANGESKSVQVGSYEIQSVDDNTNAAVISFDKSE